MSIENYSYTYVNYSNIFIQEPHSNGPLFVETNFYLRATQKDSIEQWKQDQGLFHLGVPHVEGKNCKLLIKGCYWQLY